MSTVPKVSAVLQNSSVYTFRCSHCGNLIITENIVLSQDYKDDSLRVFCDRFICYKYRYKNDKIKAEETELYRLSLMFSKRAFLNNLRFSEYKEVLK